MQETHRNILLGSRGYGEGHVIQKGIGVNIWIGMDSDWGIGCWTYLLLALYKIQLPAEVTALF